MSLNGLEDPKVLEAYQASVAEPGGWFLLKYASRDEIDLLGRGSGGIVDIRTKIAEYEETSPLYGFLRYRRRNVLIKYLPEDCSRLIQARVAVHFNAVCERFSPYDTTFEITTAKELKDTKLSAACSLHAASGSNSSASSSIRRRRLVEIAEEEEEEQQQRATKRQSRSQEANEDDRPRTPQSDRDASSDIAPVTLNSDLASSPEETKFSASSTSEVPNFVGVDELSGSPENSGESAPRLSSQSSRQDYMSYPYVYGKPKVKLGPRPSVDSNGRPRTAGSFRPVSQMPAGIKMFGKGSKKGKKEDGSQTEDDIVEHIPSSTMSITEEDRIAPIEVVRPATSSGVSIAATIVPTPSPSRNVMSPEKARLMKAMKLREKKKKTKNLTVDPSGPRSPELLSPSSSEFAGTEETVDDDLDAPPSISNADSAIGLEGSSSPTTDHASEVTQTDSHPTSPVIASSEADRSTKASSVSESTDETVEAKADNADNAKHPDDVFAVATPEKEKELSDATESNPETPAASIAALDDSISLKTAETPATTNDEDTDQTNAQPESGSVATPMADSDDIPATQTSVLEESPNDSGAKTDQIPDVTGTTENETVKNEEENFTPSLRISTATLPGHDRSGALIESEDAAEKPEETQNPEVEGESSDAKPKRKTVVDPIRTDFHHCRNDSRMTSFSDDDELMDELQSATVQEAKPMLVSKSPVTPVFPSPTKSDRSGHTVRTVSNPVRGTLLVPGDVNQSSARSVSTGAAFLHKVAQQPVGPNMAKKSNMGSSISQRIKALEKLSATSSEAGSRPASRERPSSAFFSVRKGREPTRSGTIIDRTNSFTRSNNQTPPSTSGSQDESPDAVNRRPRRDRSASVASRLSMFEPVPGEGYSPSSTSTARGRPETISVTAKIIRDSPQTTSKPFEPPKDHSDFSHLELKESPLLVDHQKPVWTPVALEHNKEKEKESLHERRMSKESNNPEPKSRRSSLSVVKDFIKERRKSVTSNSSDVLSPGSHRQPSRSPTRPPSTHQNTAFDKLMSISSRRSSISKERDTVLSPTLTEGSVSSDDSKSTSDKKTKSRAGRFMRRLSSLSGGSRGKVAVPAGGPPTVTEEDTEPIRPATTAGNASIVAHLGDVNVQFPDNLLWKRRNMCLDAQGFLILSAIPGQSGRAAQGSKRYHMSEFRQPYLPDVDVQELPHSVVLDFMEGSGIQVACTDRAGQTKVLQTLQEAHRKNAARLGH